MPQATLRRGAVQLAGGGWRGRNPLHVILSRGARLPANLGCEGPAALARLSAWIEGRWASVCAGGELALTGGAGHDRAAPQPMNWRAIFALSACADSWSRSRFNLAFRALRWTRSASARRFFAPHGTAEPPHESRSTCTARPSPRAPVFGAARHSRASARQPRDSARPSLRVNETAEPSRLRPEASRPPSSPCAAPCEPSAPSAPSSHTPAAAAKAPAVAAAPATTATPTEP